MGISGKSYILGRREKVDRGVINIGRYYALDASLGADVFIDALKPHVILICGKRGYGKSYTMGVFIEEMLSLEEEIRKNIGIVVVDTLGIFWTLFYPNEKEKDLLERWKLKPKNFDLRILSSPINVEEYRKKGIEARKLLIKTDELSPLHWAQLFNLKPTDYVSAIIGRAINELGKNFSIDDMIDYIKNDERIKDEAKVIAENFLLMAKSWEIFDKNGLPINEVVKAGKATVLDLSSYPEELKIVVVALIARKIFEARIRERRKYEEAMIERKELEEEIPQTWLAIDEAHVFLPMERCLSKDILIKQWMRQGRQPGVSLILATQRPSSLDEEVLSHSDIIICHRLTSQEDIDALSKIRPTYMLENIEEAIKKVGTEKGVALIIDDTSETTHVIKVRPRLSWHGGEEPSALRA